MSVCHTARFRFLLEILHFSNTSPLIACCLTVGDGAVVSVEHPLVQDTAKLANASVQSSDRQALQCKCLQVVSHVLLLSLPALSLGGVTILRKGTIDLISNGREAMLCAGEGCPRRVGGQGDVLAGACGTFVAWTRMATDKEQREKAKLPVIDLPVQSPIVFAAYAASSFARKLQKEVRLRISMPRK